MLILGAPLGPSKAKISSEKSENPTGNADDDFGIDLVLHRLRPLSTDRRALAVSTSFGFGGANAAVVLGDPFSGSPEAAA